MNTASCIIFTRKQPTSDHLLFIGKCYLEKLNTLLIFTLISFYCLLKITESYRKFTHIVCVKQRNSISIQFYRFTEMKNTKPYLQQNEICTLSLS